VIRAALAVAATLFLGACASTAHNNWRPPQTPAAPDSAAPVSAVPRVRPDQRTLMVDGATAMLGQPYRFGGAARGGFDCSGLIFYAAATAGIRVPRTAAEQLDFGVAVRRADLHAGDLIFMNLAHKELHVGLALDRELFIHAPSSGGHVRIDSLAAAPYSKGFIGARRVTP
jgi:cell wall-associated NlpC family hydrolase